MSIGLTCVQTTSTRRVDEKKARASTRARSRAKVLTKPTKWIIKTKQNQLEPYRHRASTCLYLSLISFVVTLVFFSLLQCPNIYCFCFSNTWCHCFCFGQMNKTIWTDGNLVRLSILLFFASFIRADIHKNVRNGIMLPA